MTSPFKFLDPYGPEDRDIFFGREEEIEELYQLLFQACLVLVYGPSGAGKTSLIQCGLANRFQPTDWLPLTIRRQKDINAALAQAIRSQATTPIADDASAVEALRSLYLDHLRPAYLIFDQFEEFFILGSAEEQDAFFATVAEVQASDVSCKIVLCLREEYLAALHRFEKSVPTLYNKRLRVEPMSMANVRQVIVSTTAKFGIGLEHGEATAQKIIDNLDDGRLGVDLTNLQVYLDGLYQRAAKAGGGSPMVFTDAAIDEAGKFDKLIDDVLEEQTAKLQMGLTTKDAAPDPQAVRRILERFATAGGTKRPRSRDALATRLTSLDSWLDEILAGLESARIIRNVDGLYELSHDSLARAVAARRSDERKAIDEAEKLIRRQMSAFDDSKKSRDLLDSADLAMIRRVRSELELSGEETEFWEKSKKRALWERFKWLGCSLGLGCLGWLVLAVGGFVYLLGTSPVE